MSSLEALSDPIRLKVVRHLEHRADASLHELARAAGVHVNTVRPHVAALVDAGSLVRETARPHGRGRPQMRYRLAGHWAPPTSDFRDLAAALAAVALRRRARPRDMRSVGLEWGRFLLGRPGAHDAEREVPRALERLGFSARLDGDRLAIAACPCAQVLPEQPELVCELAIGVVDGVLAGCGSERRVAERRHDPPARSCSARLATSAHA
jgi:predicted ArsR family transcriptional regulator